MDIGQENSGRGPTYRAALIAVIILSSLFVAGVVALIIGFMRQYQIYQAGSRSGVNNMGVGAPPAVVELEPGAHIVSVTTMSNRLILQLDTPKGSEVEVMDLATGKLLFRMATPHP